MWNTFGHDKAVAILDRSLAAGRLSHAYLLAGPRHVGKMTLALDLARMVNCSSEERPCSRCDQCSRIARGVQVDIKTIGVEPERDGDGRGRVAISIEQVRELQREANLKPYEGKYRVFIFENAERLSEAAANSLLKTLEEPPEQVILALLATDASDLLPTIVSRCQVLELRPVGLSLLAGELEGRFELESDRARELGRLSGGRPGWAIRAVTEPEFLERREARLEAIEAAIHGTLAERFDYAMALAASSTRDRDAGREELALWLEWWRDVLVTSEGGGDFVTNLSRSATVKQASVSLSSAQIAGALGALLDTREHLERNVNPRLALEDLMLRLPRPDG